MKTIALTLISCFLISCAHVKEQNKLRRNEKIGDSLVSQEYDGIYFAAQPSDTDLEKLGKQGFIAVIDLRDPDEHDWQNESNILKKDSVSYYNVPFSNNEGIQEDKVNEVTANVMKHRKDGKILIHCSTGNRAALWAGAHFYHDHNYTKDRSIEMANDLGLNKKPAKKKLWDYLKTR